jgi:cytochrome bd-type quinol oxidase subunit 1
MPYWHIVTGSGQIQGLTILTHIMLPTSPITGPFHFISFALLLLRYREETHKKLADFWRSG